MTTRRSLLRVGLVTLFALAWSPPSEAGGEVIAVIVNEKNPANLLAAADLRPIFQTTKTRWQNDVEAVPINLPNEDGLRGLRIEFDRVVLGLDPERVARYWQDRRIRGGARPPKRVTSPGAVLRAVASHPGAVGYVRAGDVTGNVKVVAKISGGKLLAP
jgi:ABC-type phosphate transport system substrate-binding protein